MPQASITLNHLKTGSRATPRFFSFFFFTLSQHRTASPCSFPALESTARLSSSSFSIFLLSKPCQGFPKGGKSPEPTRVKRGGTGSTNKPLMIDGPSERHSSWSLPGSFISFSTLAGIWTLSLVWSLSQTPFNSNYHFHFASLTTWRSMRNPGVEPGRSQVICFLSFLAPHAPWEHVMSMQFTIPMKNTTTRSIWTTLETLVSLLGSFSNGSGLELPILISFIFFSTTNMSIDWSRLNRVGERQHASKKKNMEKR